MTIRERIEKLLSREGVREVGITYDEHCGVEKFEFIRYAERACPFERLDLVDARHVTRIENALRASMALVEAFNSGVKLYGFHNERYKDLSEYGQGAFDSMKQMEDAMSKALAAFEKALETKE